jgi:hypothetical protein
MIDHLAMQKALREHVRDLVVLTTGSTSLGATGTTYTRASGSFVTDGFAPGMEVTPSGFTDTAVSVVKSVAALTLTVSRTLTTETASSGRTLSVGLPSRVAYENIEFEPVTGSPWVREELVSGPVRMLTTIDNGTIEFDPLYLLDVNVPEKVGTGAVNRYADKLMDLFAPPTQIDMSDGNVIQARTDTMAYRGPVRHVTPGFASVRVTLPLRLHLINN